MLNFQNLQKELSEVFQLAKLFFKLRLAKAREFQSSIFRFGSKPKVALLFTSLLPLFFPIYALIIVIFVVPTPPAIFDFVEVNERRITLLDYFGNGFTFVGFCVQLLFVLVFVVSFSNTRTNFCKAPHAELIHCSPVPLRKLLAGDLLSTSILSQYWTWAFIMSTYLVYRIWTGLLLTIIGITLITAYSLILTVTAGLLGATLGILSLGDRNFFLKSKAVTVAVVAVLFSIIALITDFVLGGIVYQPLTPLGWFTMGFYSLFTGKKPEYQLTVMACTIILLVAIKMVPKRLPEGDVQIRKHVTVRKPSFLQDKVRIIACCPFRGETRKLAGILFSEEWERKRPLKFLMSAILVALVFLVTQSFLYRLMPGDFHLYIPVVSFLFSIVSSVAGQLQREMAYSFFNLDGRFLFYRSTTLGFSSISKIRLTFFIIWEIPVILAGAFCALLIDQLSLIITWISLAIAAVLLITSAVFLFHSIRPRYFTTTTIQLDDTLLLMPLTLTLVLVLVVVGEALISALPAVISAMSICSIAVVVSVLSVNWGIRKLEREESLH